jgi:hypothetical protein
VVFFGVIEILIGTLCAGLLCLMAVAAMFASRLPADQAPSLEGSAILLGAFIYAVAAAFFVVMGIGTIRARRWARAIMLIVAWPWLLTAILGGVFLVIIARPLAADMGTSQAGLVVMVMIVLALFMALIPLAFILFYSGRNVKRIFDTRDTRPCWTDGRPAAVLGLALVMILGGVAALAGLHYRVAALFGWVLTGGPAVMFTLAQGALCVWLGWELYRMTTIGWWANLAWSVLAHLSWGITLARVGIDGVLRAMQFDEARLVPLRQTGMMAALGSEWIVALSCVAWVALLLSVKKNFKS